LNTAAEPQTDRLFKPGETLEAADRSVTVFEMV
jgi:hypothetical protein